MAVLVRHFLKEKEIMKVSSPSKKTGDPVPQNDGNYTWIKRCRRGSPAQLSRKSCGEGINPSRCFLKGHRTRFQRRTFTEKVTELSDNENFTTVLFGVTCPRRPLLTQAGDDTSGYHSHTMKSVVRAGGDGERRGGRGPHRTSLRKEYSVSNCCRDRRVGFRALPLISAASI